MKKYFLVVILFIGFAASLSAQENIYVHTIFDSEHQAMLGHLKEYKKGLSWYKTTQYDKIKYKKTYDSLYTIILSSNLKNKDKSVYFTIIDSCMNKEIGDVSAIVSKMDTSQVTSLNKLISLLYIYHLDADMSSTLMIENKITSWAKVLYKFSYDKPIDYYDAQRHLLADSVFRHEITQYQFKKGETIADIGAGSAYFERALSKYSDFLTVYVTEIDSATVSQLETKLALLDSTDQKKITYIPTLGTIESTGLASINFDKILIRNTFHHFSNPDRMLQRIKSSLKKEGKLYIVDIMLNETKNSPACTKHITRETFMEYMDKNGFILVKETPLQYDEFILFEFRKK